MHAEGIYRTPKKSVRGQAKSPDRRLPPVYCCMQFLTTSRTAFMYCFYVQRGFRGGYLLLLLIMLLVLVLAAFAVIAATVGTLACVCVMPLVWLNTAAFALFHHVDNNLKKSKLPKIDFRVIARDMSFKYVEGFRETTFSLRGT